MGFQSGGLGICPALWLLPALGDHSAGNHGFWLAVGMPATVLVVGTSPLPLGTAS